jgi:hypothetical protein
MVERPYLARTGPPCRAIRGVEAMHAADGIAAWRWWTLAELEAADEEIWPADLLNIIRQSAQLWRPPAERPTLGKG